MDAGRGWLIVAPKSPCAILRGVVQNPKSEFRNPKQLRNLKSKCSKPVSNAFSGFGGFGFESFGHWDLFRISDLKSNLPRRRIATVI
jgi:hypothetical protein